MEGAKSEYAAAILYGRPDDNTTTDNNQRPETSLDLTGSSHNSEASPTHCDSDEEMLRSQLHDLNLTNSIQSSQASPRRRDPEEEVIKSNTVALIL